MNVALLYAVLAMAAGVFYGEFISMCVGIFIVKSIKNVYYPLN